MPGDLLLRDHARGNRPLLALKLNESGPYSHQIGRARDLGMRAVAAIHPAQLPVIRATLAPSEAETAWVQKVLGGAVTGDAVFALDGAMIDAPVIARARRTIAAARRG